ncbi:2-keto-4-pentenoate hydratase [Pseudazoarcus pumilus]|uniref:2-keto-4-pentenoate hydratase n=1 Tax=Pseudazoarcus pumilus TaxID=2067960 RepID=A0A2I6SA00_9RHOO|nr:fumarylacetoacetate hydrolase family protein [Pseudazoarcus pumilus]AUN96086.1 2-keto-4-pentenoate hydratase [Pseudazoarcus pumilus]
MDKQAIQQAAQALLDARARGVMLQQLPRGCEPADFAEAYEIQDAVSEALGAVGGWKVGAKEPGAEPTCAPIPTSAIHESGFKMPAYTAGQCGIECEIAVRMKHDLPPRGRPYEHDEVMAAIESVHPAFEIVTYRIAAHAHVSRVTLATDAFGNGAFVYGDGRPDLVGMDQTTQQAMLDVDGERWVEKTGGNPAGDVFRLVTWLANHVVVRAGGLKAGQFVTTGSCTGMLFVDGGEELRADFPGLGVVEMSIGLKS